MIEKVIVTANYRRVKEAWRPPWLFFKNDNGVKEVASVHAIDVEFKQFPKLLGPGFGCKVAAYCKKAAYDFPKVPTGHMQPIEFDDRDPKNPVFRLKYGKQEVRSCKHLILEPTGEIRVVL